MAGMTINDFEEMDMPALKPNTTLVGPDYLEQASGSGEIKKINVNLQVIYNSLLDRWGIDKNHALRNSSVITPDAFYDQMDRVYDVKVGRGFEKVSNKISSETDKIYGMMDTISKDLLTYQTSMQNSFKRFELTGEDPRPVSMSTINAEKDYTNLFKNLAYLIPGRDPNTIAGKKVLLKLMQDPKSKQAVMDKINSLTSLTYQQYIDILKAHNN